MKPKLKSQPSSKLAQVDSSQSLVKDVRDLILAARTSVARGVNSALVVLYWRIGERIRKDVLKSARSGYGDEILWTLSKELMTEFGRGFSWPNLSRGPRTADQRLEYTQRA